MTDIQRLPLLEGTKFIILDEGVEATLAETLIIGWLKMLEKTKFNNKIEMLLFSNPKQLFSEQFTSLKLNNINLIDFFSIKVDDTEFLEEKLQKYLTVVPQNCTVILNCLSTLSLSIGLQKTIWFVEKLKEKSEQLISIYRRDFGKLNVPKIETFGTTYVKFEQSLKVPKSTHFVYEVIYTHRKIGGSILRQSELITQDVRTYEITSTKVLNNINQKTKKVTPKFPKEVKASFRIETNEQETEQRRNTPLPYTSVQNPQQTTIFYEADDLDDDDEEEDLDDDLGI